MFLVSFSLFLLTVLLYSDINTPVVYKLNKELHRLVSGKSLKLELCNILMSSLNLKLNFMICLNYSCPATYLVTLTTCSFSAGIKSISLHVLTIFNITFIFEHYTFTQ